MSDALVDPTEYHDALERSLQLSRLGQFQESKRSLEDLLRQIDGDQRDIDPAFVITVLGNLVFRYLAAEPIQIDEAFQCLDRAFRLALLQPNKVVLASAVHQCVLCMIFDWLPRFRGRHHIRDVAKDAIADLRGTYEVREDLAAECLLGVISWLEEKPDEMERHIENVAQEHGITEDILLYKAYCSRLRDQPERAAPLALESFEAALASVRSEGDWWSAVPKLALCIKFVLETYMDCVVDALRSHDYTGAINKLAICQRLATQVEESLISDEEAITVYAKQIRYDLSVLEALIRVDAEIEELFRVATLQDFVNKAIVVARTLPKQPLAAEPLRELCFCKGTVVILPLVALSGYGVLSAEERVHWLERARQLCMGMRLLEGKQAVDAVESFVLAVDEQRRLPEESRRSHDELLTLLKPAYALVRELTRAVAEKQRAEMFKDDLIGSVRQEIANRLTEATVVGQLATGSSDTGGAERPYAKMWTNEHELRDQYHERTDTGGAVCLTSGEVEELRSDRRKGGTVQILIIDHGTHERLDVVGEVYIDGEASGDLGGHEYRILYHLLTNWKHEHRRTLADLARYCWFEPELAGQLERREALPRAAAKIGNKIRALIVWLNARHVKCQYEKRDGKIALEPWPTFCVIHVVQPGE